MKKIVPFKKEVLFKSNISEIVSISLENDLCFKDNDVIGSLTISGQYKINDSSINTEGFNYELPVEINIDEKYDVKKSTIDIDDFYYEIINSNTLSVNIDILIDKLEEIFMDEEIANEIPIKTIETTERCIEEEPIFPVSENSSYSTYNIYIVRDGDTIDVIMGKYGVDKETLEEYNDLKEIKIGDKIIIPFNAKN